MDRNSIGIVRNVEPAIPRRHVFLVTAVAPGGTLSVMRQFWTRLARSGPVEVVSHGPDRVAIPVASTVVGGRYGGPMRFPGVWVYLVRMVVAAVRAARGPGPAVLFPQDSLATGAAAAIAGRLTRTPVLLMEHGSAIAVGSEYYWSRRIVMTRRRDRWTKPLLRASVRLLHHLCVRLVDLALVAGDESEAALRSAGMPARRIRRYHFPVEIDRFRPAQPGEKAQLRAELGISPGIRVVASVSRLTHEKGLDLLIDALAALPTNERPMLVAAGDGPMRPALEAAATTRDVSARFPGDLDRDAVARLLRASDAFVYAGRQGANTPYAVLEAMASGLPVIATTEPVAHLAMLADGRGHAIPPDDTVAMTSALGQVIRDPDGARDSGLRARRYVESHHAPATLDRELHEIMASLAPRP